METEKPSLDASLIAAYLHTEYRVDGDDPMTLRVGIPNPSIGDHLRNFHAHSAAYITACNPQSQLVDFETNAQRLATLEAELHSRGLRFLRGRAVDPYGEWPEEDSFLVMGLSLESAKTLARHYQQNALIWCGPTWVPELILLR
jgi:hypothetical protein